VSAEAVAMAIAKGDPDDLVFDVILTAGSNSLTIDKTFVNRHVESNKILRTSSASGGQMQLGRTPSVGRTRSSTKIDRIDAYFSRLGQATRMEGTGIVVKPVHPPKSLDADMEPQDYPEESLSGKIAVFVLHPRRMNLSTIYDCSFRSERQQALGAVFCMKNPELVAAERYVETDMQKSYDVEQNSPAPKQLSIPVICVGEMVKNALEHGVVLTVAPNTSIVRGLLADKKVN